MHANVKQIKVYRQIGYDASLNYVRLLYMQYLDKLMVEKYLSIYRLCVLYY